MVAAAFVRLTAASSPLAFLWGTAAPAARDLVVVDACVVCLLFEGLGVTSAFDSRSCLCAADGCLSAPHLLAGDGDARCS